MGGKISFDSVDSRTGFNVEFEKYFYVSLESYWPQLNETRNKSLVSIMKPEMGKTNYFQEYIQRHVL